MTASAMERFAKRQISELAKALSAEFRTAAAKPDEKAIHRLRVAIRRFTQSLTVFEGYVPADPAKGILKRLRQVMRLSSAVRDIDIALLYLKEHSHAAGDLKDRRARFQQELLDTLNSDLFSDKWRTLFRKEAA